MKALEKNQVSDEIQKIITEEETRLQETFNPRDEGNLGITAYKHPKYVFSEESIDDPIDWLEDRSSDDMVEYTEILVILRDTINQNIKK